MTANSSSEEVDAYIAEFPPDVQKILKKIRATVRQAAPAAEERISYRVPAYFQNGVVVYFAAFKKHIGLFPPVRGNQALVRAAAPYAGPKGNLQFLFSEPIPYPLIKKIVSSRVREAKSRAVRARRSRVTTKKK
jgi:uncharacterized protein YdhG (YjbR/CyaY superfamily)